MCGRIGLVILAVGWLIGWVERGMARAHEVLDSEQVLHAAHLEVNGPALLEFFRLRTRPNADPARIATLIRQLAAASFTRRQKAVGELIALGPLAMPALRKAVHDPDEAVIAAEARHCLHIMEQSSHVVQAAARLIAQCRPSGATEVLLDYLPFADDARVSEEIQEALIALTMAANQPDPVLLRALTDPSSLRRAVAAEVLCQAYPDPEVQARVRPLLRDPRSGVRLRVALALAPLQDRDAIGTLIDLLGELPVELGQKARAYLIAFAGPQAPTTPLTADASARKRCQTAWAAWWRGNDGTALLQEFRQRSLSEASRSQIKALTRRLGDDAYTVREKSLKGLISFGPPVIPLLRPLLRDPDPEIACRIRQCLELVKKDTTASTLLPPLAQLVALRQPEGAAAALLAYLPFTEDEIVLESVQTTLNTLALRNGKPDPALMTALTDPLPQRRGAAAEALGLARIPALRSTLRQLLQDPEPSVRMRVARSLAAVGNKEAVPVLIASLAEMPWEYGAQVEEWLRQLAGDRAPNIYLATEATARCQCRDAWAAWWQANNVTVDLVNATRQRPLGYTIVVCPNTGRVYEVNRHGHMRWQLNELQYPRDVQILANNRILIAEQNGRRVTERNFKNEILWEKQGDGPVIACQRLPNGHTFMVMSNQLLEVDRRGKEVFHYPRPSYDITTARRLLNGHVVFCTTTRECIRLDAKGVEVKRFQLNQAPMSLDVLPNGRILVPIQGTQQVVEYDSNGKVIWKASVPFPVSAVRLPNGNTLVASMNKQTILELNRNGRVVWEHKTQEHPCSARRR